MSNTFGQANSAGVNSAGQAPAGLLGSGTDMLGFISKSPVLRNAFLGAGLGLGSGLSNRTALGMGALGALYGLQQNKNPQGSAPSPGDMYGLKPSASYAMRPPSATMPGYQSPWWQMSKATPQMNFQPPVASPSVPGATPPWMRGIDLSNQRVRAPEPPLYFNPWSDIGSVGGL
jgi:hypothetical protein